MAIYDDAKELIGAISEIRRLREQIGKIALTFDDIRTRLSDVEKRLDRDEINASHQSEKTVLGVKLAVTESVARFEGDVRERLTRLESRLETVESASLDPTSAKKLPRS